MGIDVSGFSPVEQTALLTQYARALDSRWPRPILGDTLADEIVARIDYDFAALGVPTSVVCQSALRAKMLDDRVRAFVSDYPDGVVVDLGAGLDTDVIRVDPPAGVDWYSVDLPNVIAVRDELMPARKQAHSVARSAADPHWAEAIPRDRPAMVIADGLFAFLSEPVIVGIFAGVTDQFGSGQLAFNDYGRIGWFSSLAVKLDSAGHQDLRAFCGVGAQSPHPAVQVLKRSRR